MFDMQTFIQMFEDSLDREVHLDSCRCGTCVEEDAAAEAAWREANLDTDWEDQSDWVDEDYLFESRHGR